MKVKINLEKKWFVFSVVVLFLIGGTLGFVIAELTASPAVFGHSVDEVEGLAELIASIVSSQISSTGTMNCTTVIYNSYDETGTPNVKATPSWTAVNISTNSGCIGSTPCTLRQEIYNEKGLKLLRFYEYSQDSVTKKWWSSYSTSGRKINGDASEDNIIPSYEGDIVLKDDRKGYEELPNLWVGKDTSASYGHIIRLCTELPEPQGQ